MGQLAAQMLLCSFLWSTAFLFMKVLGEELSPFALAALRGLMGAGLLGAWLAVQGQKVLPVGREWRDWAVLGLLQGALPNVLTAYALLSLAAGFTAFIQSMTPLVVAVFAHILFADERLTWRRAGGVALGFTGMVILLGPAILAGNKGSLSAILAMIVTVLSYAFGNLYVRAIPDAVPLRLAYGQQAFAGVPALFFVLIASGTEPFAPAGGHALALLGFGLFATAAPIVLYMNVIRAAGPTLGSMNGYLVPIWTVLLAAVLLDEVVALRELIGGAVILVGMGVVAFYRPRPLARVQRLS